MIVVLIPAHNEAQHLKACLLSVKRSLAYLQRHGLQGVVVVVADACTDLTPQIARQYADHVLVINARNVGEARRSGAQWLIEYGVDWIACTDADSQVPLNWLHAQYLYQADVFCGIVRIEDWGDYSSDVIKAFHATVPKDGHPHIHGANLGISRDAYLQAGGFLPATAHEDVALIRRCEQAGLRIARRIQPSVVTSARRDARAREGFGDFLLKLEGNILQSRGVSGESFG